MMIISASYKTDIPNYYGKWFMNRLDAGFCKMINPYNRKAYKINLKHSNVDGFVIWTKNLKPFFDNLKKIYKKNYPFMIQYTINNYPQELEHSIVYAEKSINQMKKINESFDPRSAVWRYDTILFTSLTPFKYHIRNFSWLAEELEGTTDEVIISFAQFYKKTVKNINLAAKKFNFSWEDPSKNTKLDLVKKMIKIANNHKMKLRICSQPQFLVEKTQSAHCVDAHRLSDVAGFAIDAELKPRRPGCGCYASRDIGEYDTCPHGCVYCYAVRNRKLALKRFQEHDPNSEFLFEPKKYDEAKESSDKEKETKKRSFQMRLPKESE
ncbi:MAG: DUF1848 domain-containing protein [Candidatus Methanofastidiosia archaeon]|jgi:hypothetical protein